MPGDINQDARYNVTDAVGLLLHLFGSRGALPCGSDAGNQALLDLNGDERVDLADGIHGLVYLFQAGPEPALGSGCVAIDDCESVCGS